MSAKQAIKQIVPRPIWAKLQSVKETHNGRKAEKTQSQRFMRWISLDSSTDKARVQTRLAFDIHRLEKGLSHHIHFRLGFGKGVLSEISKRLVLLEKADPAYSANPLYNQGLAVPYSQYLDHAFEIRQ